MPLLVLVGVIAVACTTGSPGTDTSATAPTQSSPATQTSADKVPTWPNGAPSARGSTFWMSSDSSTLFTWRLAAGS